jgi:hypothetical protein
VFPLRLPAAHLKINRVTQRLLIERPRQLDDIVKVITFIQFKQQHVPEGVQRYPMMKRRMFTGTAVAGALAAPNLTRAKDGGKQLRVACVGVGGKGYHDLRGVETEKVVALCDVEPKSIQKAKDVFPDAKIYTVSV